MIQEMIAGIGPLATWVILLGVLPVTLLVGVMWSLDQVIGLGTDLSLAFRRRRKRLPGSKA